MFCVAFFAFFHGYAHGNEFPEYDNVQWLYVLGFMVGTAGLHITGVVIGLASEQLKQGPRILRHLGSIMAGIGIHMAIGYVEYSMFWEK